MCTWSCWNEIVPSQVVSVRTETHDTFGFVVERKYKVWIDGKISEVKNIPSLVPLLSETQYTNKTLKTVCMCPLGQSFGR